MGLALLIGEPFWCHAVGMRSTGVLDTARSRPCGGYESELMRRLEAGELESIAHPTARMRAARRALAALLDFERLLGDRDENASVKALEGLDAAAMGELEQVFRAGLFG